MPVLRWPGASFRSGYRRVNLTQIRRWPYGYVWVLGTKLGLRKAVADFARFSRVALGKLLLGLWLASVAWRSATGDRDDAFEETEAPLLVIDLGFVIGAGLEPKRAPG